MFNGLVASSISEKNDKQEGKTILKIYSKTEVEYFYSNEGQVVCSDKKRRIDVSFECKKIDELCKDGFPICDPAEGFLALLQRQKLLFSKEKYESIFLEIFSNFLKALPQKLDPVDVQKIASLFPEEVRDFFLAFSSYAGKTQIKNNEFHSNKIHNFLSMLGETNKQRFLLLEPKRDAKTRGQNFYFGDVSTRILGIAKELLEQTGFVLEREPIERLIAFHRFIPQGCQVDSSVLQVMCNKDSETKENEKFSPFLSRETIEACQKLSGLVNQKSVRNFRTIFETMKGVKEEEFYEFLEDIGEKDKNGNPHSAFGVSDVDLLKKALIKIFEMSKQFVSKSLKTTPYVLDEESHYLSVPNEYAAVVGPDGRLEYQPSRNSSAISSLGLPGQLAYGPSSNILFEQKILEAIRATEKTIQRNPDLKGGFLGSYK